MIEIPPVIDFPAWIAEHEHLLQPPVNNQQLYVTNDDFIVMVVGGPNQRTDYHVDPYEEWFYQYRGAIHVDLMTSGGPERVDIAEGQMWMLPRNVPHSPQRPDAGSIGIVIERIREPGRTEQFLWFCRECHDELYRVDIDVSDIVVDLPPAFERFYGDPDARRCDECGAVHPGRG